MLPPADLQALTDRLEQGRRTSSPPLLFLGRACGRLAGTPDLDELARQALAVLDPERRPAPEITFNPRQIKELHRALLSAVPTRGALEQMLVYGGVASSLSQISSEGSLTSTVYNVLDWASAHGKLDALVSAAAAYNPGNTALRTLTGRQTKADSQSSSAVLEEFRARFRELSSLERYSLLQTIYSRIPVPSFYQELARLLKARYLRHVMTTNVDQLLEQSLESVGLYRDSDYTVVMLGAKSTRDVLDRLSEVDAAAVLPLIVKLHGDISQEEFSVTPEEIDRAVYAARRFIDLELQSEFVIVGYEGESAPLNDWLGGVSTKVWWVHTESPGAMSGVHDLTWLQLSPADFFTVLAPQLLTLRATTAATPRGGRETAPQAPFKGITSFEVTSQPLQARPQGENELLTQEIDRLLSEAQALEQTPASTGTALQRQEQIAQRRRRIRELEDQLRALPAAREEILNLLERVQQSVNEAGQQPDESIDPETIKYFTGQVETLRVQYQSPQPNAHVVSAALGAALVIANRLGPGVIDPEDAQALASFGPTTLTRMA